MKILIVDDDSIARAQVKSLLSKYGDCDSSPNGEIALAMLKAAAEEKAPYNLITIDIRMPKMSGQELLKHIRSYESEKKIQPKDAVKAIMITASEDFADVKSSYQEGCEYYCVKPVTQDKIDEIMAEMAV